MKTIEQYEVEIDHKSQLIIDGLKEFSDNITKLGEVAGEDPQYVYSVLESKYMEVLEAYTTSTRRNVEILEGYVIKLDKILVVLSDVHTQIDKMNAATEQGTLEQVAHEVTENVKELANDVESYLEEKVEGDFAKMAIIGASSYIVLRLIGLGRLPSLGAAGAAAYMFGKKKEVAEEAVATEIAPA